jgi:Holliday junction resolvase RusA-like endonuclease
MQQHNWDMLPKAPLALNLDYTVAGRLHGFDLDNVVKAVADAMQDIVIPNDLWIDEIRASRELGEKYFAVIKIATLQE